MNPNPVRHARKAHPDGQIIVLAALLMIILIGIVGLAIDVSAAYMADRWQRSVADAAALAGGQDLQQPGSRALPGPSQYQSARDHAMDVLWTELGASSRPSVSAGSPCLTAAGCALPGTGYVVAVRTDPSPSCVDCDPRRAIQVTVQQPSFGLTLGRIFGQSSWTVTSRSVAGIVQARQYGVVTLRGTRPRGLSGGDANEDDIFVTGGSTVRVDNADIGTNTNLIIDASDVILQPGFSAYYFDTYQGWAAPPPGVNITSPIPDPGYTIPDRADVPSTPRYTVAGLSDAMLGGAPGSSACQAEMAKVPAQYTVGGTPIHNMPPAKVTCYKPGIYTRELSNGHNDEAVLLTPGVYFFDRGLDIGATLVGGYEASQPGIALVFNECSSASNCPLAGNNSPLIALNFGSAYRNASGHRAEAAMWNGNPVVTAGSINVLMTLMVVPDPACYVAVQEPSNTCTTHNHTLILPGGGSIFVAGVQYAPSDNSVVTGGSGSGGILGQIISWTIRFTGASGLNLEAAVADNNGVLRLDPACSPTVTTCNP